MGTSATGLGLRERQGLERREAIAFHARELTAEHGFSGFTIEELCERVGISRRTFFNYFPSKEQAIFGRPQDGLEGDAAVDFVENRDGVPLLEGLVFLGAHHLVSIGVTPAHAASFAAILKREPQLLATAMETGKERDALIAALVAERDGMAVDDPAIPLAIQLSGTILRGAMIGFLHPDTTATLPELAAAQLAIARTLCAA